MNVQHSTSRVAAAAGGMLLGILVMIGLSAMADGDPTTDTVPRMLPYTGTLEQNGQPVNAVGENAIHILFSLYDAADAEAPVYNQPLRLEVYAGRFTATIGPVGLGPNNEEVAIADVVAAADDLHLGMTLLGDPEDPEDDLPLTNRQRIMATPYAMWSTSATNFTIARALAVGGDADVQGQLRAGSVITGGSITGASADINGVLESDSLITGAITSAGISASGTITTSANITATGGITGNNLIINNLANCRICIRDDWAQDTLCVGVNDGWSGQTNEGRNTGDGTPKRIRMDCGPNF